VSHLRILQEAEDQMRSYLGWRLLREVREEGHYLRPPPTCGLHLESKEGLRSLSSWQCLPKPAAIAAHLRVFSHAVFFWNQGVWYAEMLAIYRTLSVT
jgi:hypothetical protein